MDSLKQTSMEVSNLIEIVEVIKGNTGENSLDIKILKKRHFRLIKVFYKILVRKIIRFDLIKQRQQPITP